MTDEEIADFRVSVRKFEQFSNVQGKESSTCFGVSLSQCHTLLELEILKKSTLKKLAFNLGLEKSTVSRTIEGLVQLGLVQRKDNPQNRRESNLELSKQGLKVVQKINTENNALYRNVLMKMTVAEREGFVKGFKKFLHHFDQQLQTESMCCCSK